MFKKTLSIVLSILMVTSCMTALIVPAMAVETPTGTAIDSLDDITDLTADYYLSADIGNAEALNTITVGDASNAFTGTLNGNGNTIYTSVPVFTLLGAGAEVKNLTVRGEISITNEINVSTQNFLSGGAIACASNGAFTITDCVNHANVKYTISSNHANIGGFVGYAYSCGNVMTNCVNYGNISIVGSSTAKQGRVGGMIGFGNAAATSPVSTSVLTDCKNYGTITDQSSYSLTGGMLGHYSCDENVKLDGCENYGDINGNSANAKVGGLVAVLDKNRNHEFIDCVNDADLKATKVIIGGIIGDERGTATFTDCINKGTMTMVELVANNIAGGIAATTSNSVTHTYINCVNEATITSSHYIGGIVGKPSKGATNIYGCVNKGTINVPDTCEVAAHVGGLIGEFAGDKALYVEYGKNVADIDIKTTHGTNLIGGIAGKAEVELNRTFKNCVNEGDISVTSGTSGNKIGGIAGIVGAAGGAINTTYIGCANTGNVMSYCYAGGISGQERVGGRLIACVNSGNISVKGTYATSFAAGLVANAVTATMYSCFNTGAVTNEAKEANVHELCPVGLPVFSDKSNAASAEFEGVQRSVEVENEETFAVRFVTSITDIDDYSATGVRVYSTAKDSSAVKYMSTDTVTVYTQIGAYENGVNTVYPETPVEGKYFTALTVTGISVSGSYTFIVIPYTIAIEDSAIAYGDAYSVQIVDGEITSVTALVPAQAE